MVSLKTLYMYQDLPHATKDKNPFLLWTRKLYDSVRDSRLTGKTLVTVFHLFSYGHQQKMFQMDLL